MTKEELKSYISEAVDALDPVDLEMLFPPANQPDLYTVVAELTGLKGAFNKLSGSTLKLNHEIHDLVEQVESQQAQQLQFINDLKDNEAKDIEEPETLDDDLKELLNNLLEMDEIIQLAANNYKELPTPTWLGLNQFKVKLAAWQKGFDITLNRWQKLLQTTNLYKTGLVGEAFDPELHEAVAVKHQNDLENNIILETEQTGFLYKGKVLKSAKVVVNKVKIVKPNIPTSVPEPTVPKAETVVHKIVENEEELQPIVEKAVIREKPKPKPKRKKGRGGRRKKRQRKRK
jgi:molecular chaperone GrpE